MKIGKWQWHYYHYRKEVIKGLLARIDTIKQQRRVLRRLLNALARDPKRCDVIWFIYVIAYIERSNARDRWSFQLEKRAIALLLDIGVVPPKSTLSALFVDLFSARLLSIKSSNASLLYQRLANYCCHTFCADRVLLPKRGPSISSGQHQTGRDLQQVRRLRLSGQLAEAEYLCRTCTDSAIAGELVLLYAQRHGGVTMPSIEQSLLRVRSDRDFYNLTTICIALINTTLTQRIKPHCTYPHISALTGQSSLNNLFTRCS